MEKTIIVDETSVSVKKFNREGFCETNLTVGTNGFKGGDYGHGSRTYLKLEYSGTEGILITTTKGSSCGSIEITIGGDDELESLIQNLEYAEKTLRKMSNYTGHFHEETIHLEPSITKEELTKLLQARRERKQKEKNAVKTRLENLREPMRQIWELHEILREYDKTEPEKENQVRFLPVFAPISLSGEEDKEGNFISKRFRMNFFEFNPFEDELKFINGSKVYKFEDMKPKFVAEFCDAFVDFYRQYQDYIKNL